MTTQETDPDLPVSVQESLAEVWVGGGLLQGWGTDCSGRCMGSFLGVHHYLHYLHYGLAQFSSVAQSCPTLCDPMNRSTPGLPIHHHLLEFTQTHIHRVSDAIQPSHPLSSPSPPAPDPSQHQSLFQ